MKQWIVHALDRAGGFTAVCRARVTVTSQITKDDAQITCEECRLRLTCPTCGWPIPVSAAAALAGGRRYHMACAAKLELDAPSSRK